MKLLNDYTGQEIENLTDEQVSKLIDLECAEEGVPFLPPQPVKPEVPLPEPDLKLFGVPGTDLYFEFEADAVSVRADLRSRKPVTVEREYMFGWNVGSVSWPRPITKLTDDIEVVRVHRRETLDKFKDQAARIKEQTENYDADEKAFSKIAESRQRIADYVWKTVNKALSWKQKRNQLAEAFERYFNMAECDLAVALRFFEKSNPEYVEYLRIDARAHGYDIVPVYARVGKDQEF